MTGKTRLDKEKLAQNQHELESTGVRHGLGGGLTTHSFLEVGCYENTTTDNI